MEEEHREIQSVVQQRLKELIEDLERHIVDGIRTEMLQHLLAINEVLDCTADNCRTFHILCFPRFPGARNNDDLAFNTVINELKKNIVSLKNKVLTFRQKTISTPVYAEHSEFISDVNNFCGRFDLKEICQFQAPVDFSNVEQMEYYGRQAQPLIDTIAATQVALEWRLGNRQGQALQGNNQGDIIQIAD